MQTRIIQDEMIAIARWCGICFALVAVIGTTSAKAGESVKAARTNFVLVMCDDLGWGDTGFNGNKTIRTPHLDTMARAGMTFHRFYAAAPVCSPSRGSVLTGRHPFRYGILSANSGHMKSTELTLAELLKKRDYATGHFGKWHLGTLTKTVRDSNRGGRPRSAGHYSPPPQNGFDVCFSTEAKVPTFDPMLKPAQGAKQIGWDVITDRATAVPYGTRYWNQKGEIVTDNLDGDDSRVIMDRAVPFIEQSVKQGKPFFTVIWFHTPHLPVVAGPKHAGLYAGYDSYRRNYYGCITAMDEQMGRLRATLRRLNAADNTFVAFCSDNGPGGDSHSPGSAGPFRGRKRDLFEGGVRVPALVEWPKKIAAGSKTDYPAVTSDYLSTILEIVGADYPDKRPTDGISLIPVIEGKRTERPRPIGFLHRGRVAMTDNRYKIVKYPPEKKQRSNVKQKRETTADGRPFLLFDLIADPGESNNIAAKHPEIVKRLALQLEVWQESCWRSANNHGP